MTTEYHAHTNVLEHTLMYSTNSSFILLLFSFNVQICQVFLLILLLRVDFVYLVASTMLLNMKWYNQISQ